jgi:hypothetical protein
VQDSPPESHQSFDDGEELFGGDDAMNEEDKKFLWFSPEEANEGPAALAPEPEEATEVTKLDGGKIGPLSDKEIAKLGDKATELCRQAGTVEHQYGHRWFNPFCEHCVRAAAQRTPRRKGKLHLGPKPEVFGEQTTGDHLISRNKDKQDLPECLDDDEFPGAQNGVVMHDRATDFLEAYPVASKSMDDTIESFQSWAGPKDKTESFYADNAPELKAAAKKLRWRMPTSTPGVPPVERSDRANGSQGENDR